jgi:hypothetical protein
MRNSTARKYRYIQARFRELYEGPTRRRYDDCIKILSQESYLQPSTISRVLTMQLPEGEANFTFTHSPAGEIPA